jgi:hypothetical protein
MPLFDVRSPLHLSVVFKRSLPAPRLSQSTESRETGVRGMAFTKVAGDDWCAGGESVKKLVITVGLSLALLGVSSGASAQETTENLTASGGDTSSLGTGNASASPGTVTRGSSGTALLGPDGTYSVTETAPPSISVTGDTGVIEPAYSPEPVYEPEPVSEPAPEPAPVETTTEPVVTDTAVATDGDQDGDNLIDAREYELGLDPANADADGDGVADGDEVDIYGTDPWVWDTDGDGVGDGDELFGILTDPLVWDSDGDGVSDGDAASSA